MLALLGAMAAALGACNLVAGIETIGVADASSSGQSPDADTCVPHPVLALPGSATPAPAACSAEEEDTFLVCFTRADEEINTCAQAVGGACGACLVSPEPSSIWGALLTIPIPSIPAGMDLEVNVLNVGACVLRNDSSEEGQECGNALEALVACEVAACAPYCPFTSDSDTQEEALLLGSESGGEMTNGCVQNADDSVCSPQAANASSVCPTNDAYIKCAGLRTTIESSTSSAVEMNAAASEFLQAVCGDGS